MFSLQEISFTYPVNGICAVDRVSLTIKPGRIYAILGENGAGKSTLAKICSGALCPDSGNIVLNQHKHILHNTSEGIEAGIVLVPQHPQFAPELAVWENLAIGLHTDTHLSGAFLKRKNTAAYLSEKLAQFNIDLPLFKKAKDLNTAQIHWAAFAEALLKKPSVLFLDEPTASYSPAEINRFYTILRTCAKNGMHISVITHRIQEVLEYVDTVHILRTGRLVQTEMITSNTCTNDLLQSIFDTADSNTVLPPLQPANQQENNTREKTLTGLTLNNINTAALSDNQPLVNISLAAPRGTITGIAGLKNQGLEQLEDLLSGLRKPTSGTVHFEGLPLSHIDRTNIAYIPSRRLERGVAYHRSIFENFAVRFRHSLYKGGIYSRKRIDIWKKTSKLDWNRDWNTPVFTLSGGMMQKLIFNRELENPLPEFVLCAEPYWGLDRKTQHILLNTLRNLANQKAAVLVLTSDADAALEICDCIHVLYGGAVKNCIYRKDYNRSTLINTMMQVNHNV